MHHIIRREYTHNQEIKMTRCCSNFYVWCRAMCNVYGSGGSYNNTVYVKFIGIPLTSPTCTMGDNKGMITAASIPECALEKKHVVLSYHFVREQTAVGTINPCKIDGKDNVADLLTKALDIGTFLMHTS
jgi:hypothetical protein